MSDRLQEILAAVARRVEAAQRTLPLAELAARAAERRPTRSLSSALRRSGKGTRAAGPLRVIGELKRRSPSAGAINDELDVEDGARRLEAVGCAAISVLTEPQFFGGSLQALEAARNQTTLPLLRKDFILEPYQLVEARAHGADAVLLLAAVLEDSRLLAFRDRARELGMEVLVEAHGEEELRRILALDFELVGCNARNLSTFEVDLEKALEWCRCVPPERICVAESGILREEDVRRVRATAVDAVLVGEGLMRGGRIEENHARLFGSDDDD